MTLRSLYLEIHANVYYFLLSPLFCYIYTYLNSQPFSLQDAQSQLLAEKANLLSKLDEAQKELESLQVRLHDILRFMFYIHSLYNI